ncbi:glucans biosynthesis glucosyltransferase MdoH [Methylibium sp.]|uniref:glucans biosynthesis glucosyltransferase MdoH n=1 Tax=Methylibium sp. TaxID=2067992 RepID=UPI003D0960A1
MTPVPWTGMLAGLGRLFTAPGRGGAASHAVPPWLAAAGERRRLLLALVMGSAGLATAVLDSASGPGNTGPWALLQTALFALLFAWVAAGCVTAVMGYVSLRRGDRHAMTPEAVAAHPIAEDARTAIVMPICNEDIATVVAGLRATVESLSRAGSFDRFDVYMLSDTGDLALRDAELAAWRGLRDALAADGYDSSRIFYRWRQRRTKRKAGNVADFCRRWGRAYRYMVVLDADSVMSGEALLTLVRLMEAQPKAGIIQTAPRSCGHDSLHARLQQFSGRVTGPLFTAGLRYWQLGESHYWGHNAILRVEPFMKHCALAKLPGRGGLSGEILSHDFVEAALMRRAGYEVWLLPELDGSYEQAPPHLIDELTRDRRWCQGNLQNARLVAEPGFAGVHRAMFVTGAMSYVASPIWLAFVLLGVLPWLAGDGLQAATDGAGLPLAQLLLWGATLALLLLPRVLAVLLVFQRRQEAGYGGRQMLVVSALLEALMSALQAPVRMVAHSIFVLGALTGLKLNWKSPSRETTAVGWREAVGRFGVTGTIVAAATAWWLAGQPGEAWRVLPLALPLMLAVPLAVMTSRSEFGQAWRRRGWLLIPEETRAPAVLQAAWRYAGLRPISVPAPAHTGHGVVLAGGAAGWQRRALATIGLAVATGVAVLPQTVATGGLSHSDLAAIRIVMQASSPSAAPRVLRQLPLRRVSTTLPADGVRYPVQRSATRT